jgi:thymidylate synthase
MYTIKAKNTADAWNAIMTYINLYGENILTEDGQMTREIRNLIVEIEHPGEGYPIKGTGWNILALSSYADQILDPNEKGFVYDYGSRLAQDGQIENVIGHLVENKNTRRAILSTRNRCQDMYEQHTPCLQIVEFLYREGKLHMTCFFRSNDMRDAWPSNIYGLYALLGYVAMRTNMEMGSITTHSVSAHYYVD